MNIAIRAANPSDLSAILRIEQASPEAAHWNFSHYENAVAKVEQLVMVAEDSGEIAGFFVACTATQEWELENIAVSPRACRRGIGRALMLGLIQLALQAGATEVRQEIRASNGAAQHLGRSVGFVQQGCRRNYYREPVEDALLFKYIAPIPTMSPDAPK